MNNAWHGTHSVEILHVDTKGSRDFFESCEASPIEKAHCQTLARDYFSTCCQNAGGVMDHWAGDGGFAFFQPSKDGSGCVAAACEFLNNLPWLTQQTATTLGDRFDAHRSFRVKGHFGLVHFGESGANVTAGASDQLDDFLFHERQWAPVPDEFYITDQLRAQLSRADKDLFELVRPPQTHGRLTSALHRLHTRKATLASPFTIIKDGYREMTSVEWDHLLRQVHSQKLSVAARNKITEGLTTMLAENKGVVDHNAVASLTLQSLFHFLKVDRKPHDFRLALWRRVDNPADHLEKTLVYPQEPGPARVISLKDVQYQVVRAFLTKNTIITPSVDAARVRGDWVDFSPLNMDANFLLQSAMQVPVYRNVEVYPGHFHRQPKAVLSITSNKPGLFVQDMLQTWVDDLAGFMANLCLSEHLP